MGSGPPGNLLRFARSGAVPGAVIAVTQGDEGSHWLVDGVHHHVPAVGVNAVNSNGVGDVFHGAYVLAMPKGARHATPPGSPRWLPRGSVVIRAGGTACRPAAQSRRFWRTFARGSVCARASGFVRMRALRCSGCRWWRRQRCPDQVVRRR